MYILEASTFQEKLRACGFSFNSFRNNSKAKTLFMPIFSILVHCIGTHSIHLTRNA